MFTTNSSRAQHILNALIRPDICTVNEITIALRSLLCTHPWTTHKFYKFVPGTQKHYTWAHKMEHSWFCWEWPCEYHHWTLVGTQPKSSRNTCTTHVITGTILYLWKSPLWTFPPSLYLVRGTSILDLPRSLFDSHSSLPSDPSSRFSPYGLFITWQI